MAQLPHESAASPEVPPAFIAALLALPPVFGNHGLWAALHVFLIVRGLSLGAGNWTVLSVNGRPTPLDRPFTATFTNGRLSMVLGCNRLNAPYTLAGRVMSVGAVAKTRMACADPSFEEAGEKAFAQPFNVEAIGNDGD